MYPMRNISELFEAFWPGIKDTYNPLAFIARLTAMAAIMVLFFLMWGPMAYLHACMERQMDQARSKLRVVA